VTRELAVKHGAVIDEHAAVACRVLIVVPMLCKSCTITIAVLLCLHCANSEK